MSDEKRVSVVPEPISSEPHYIAQTDNGWGVPMTGIYADDGSDVGYAGILGMFMTNLKVGSSKIKKVRVRNKRGRWLPYKTGFENELGDGSAITGIEIVGSGLVFSIHIKGGMWMNSLITSDVEGEVIGSTGSAIDAIWIDEI